MRRRPAVSVALVLALAGAACGGGTAPSPSPSGDPDASPDAAQAAPADAPPARRAVTLLWPGTKAQGLVSREAEIFATRDPADQARQVVGLLLGAPPDADVVAPLPAGTKLTALFVDARGTAYVSLSREARDGAPGGSDWEQLAVHSLVGSLTRSIPPVRRAQLLVDGREIETLSGHLDLRGPVTFDESLLAP